MGTGGIVGDAGRVWHADSSETAHLWSWSELGWSGSEWGCSDGSGSMFHCFLAGARGPEWGRVGCLVDVDGDVAVEWGSLRCGMGGWGMSWGGQGGVRELLGLLWGWWSSFIKCTTCSDEHARMTLCNSVSWAVNSIVALFTTWLMFSKVQVAVWALDIAQVLVSGVGVAGVIPIVGCDVAVAVGGSGHEMRGCWLTRQCVPLFSRGWAQF